MSQGENVHQDIEALMLQFVLTNQLRLEEGGPMLLQGPETSHVGLKAREMFASNDAM